MNPIIVSSEMKVNVAVARHTCSELSQLLSKIDTLIEQVGDAPSRRKPELRAICSTLIDRAHRIADELDRLVILATAPESEEGEQNERRTDRA